MDGCYRGSRVPDVCLSALPGTERMIIMVRWSAVFTLLHVSSTCGKFHPQGLVQIGRGQETFREESAGDRNA